MFKYATRNVVLLYFAIVYLIFILILFVPFIGFVIYNAATLTSTQFTDTKLMNINNNYKWKYRDTEGFGGYEKFQKIKCSVPIIKYLNAIESRNVYGITKFSHMSRSEFAKRMLFAHLSQDPIRKAISVLCSESDWLIIEWKWSDFHGDIPRQFDWRQKNVVGPVLDQKRCNACWAFTVVGIMETMLAINRTEHHFEQLSIQELLDCSPYTSKCEGGNIYSALDYLCLKHQAIVPDSQYPLTLHEETCLVEPNVTGTGLQRYTIKYNIHEHEIPQLIATHGPVMAVLNARFWQFYTGGVIYRSCIRDDDDPLKHVVQIVGYDMTAEIPYYIAKNSWGTDFGEGGYIKLAMHVDICGITREIAYLDVYTK